MLGARARTVKRLPKRPAANAYDAYIDKHARTVSWSEPSPTGPYGTITYSATYLPAQTKVKGSLPEMLAFSVKQPGTAQAPTGFRADRQELTCIVKDGQPVALTVTDHHLSKEKTSGRYTALAAVQHCVVGEDRISLYQYSETRGPDGNYRYHGPEYIYNESQRMLLESGKNSRNRVLAPEAFVSMLSSFMDRIPTVGE